MRALFWLPVIALSTAGVGAAAHPAPTDVTCVAAAITGETNGSWPLDADAPSMADCERFKSDLIKEYRKELLRQKNGEP